MLAQACILIDANPEQLVTPVNLCYQIHQQDERVLADVHTNLFSHIESRPTTDALFKVLFQSFVHGQR